MLGSAVLIASFALGIHNATLYNPRHGFDGKDHLFYIKYIFNYHKMPPITMMGETHQSPVYYIIGAILKSIIGTWKAAQYINIFVLWMIIGMVGLGLRKVFKKIDQVLIGMFSLTALPMLNIFPAMLTNELLSTFWIISVIVCSIFLIYSKEKKEIIFYSIWFTFNFILGYWTKISIAITLPVVLTAYFFNFMKNKKLRKTIFISIFLSFLLIALGCSPIFFRARQHYSASDITGLFTSRVIIKEDHLFFYRLDWIPKIDMYNTQYYSLLGAAWNSFWTDGHNAITPFIKFHKKSFILWSLGFIILPLSFYGLIVLIKRSIKIGIIMSLVTIIMLGTYVFVNLNSHYSAARLTYEMGIVVPYTFGLASVSQNKKIKYILLLLLSIQFIIMVSFFWIQPWWHVTK